ncbi:hypothetical protein [uncultured Pseudacidovorax sp.]|uniref:hypothetical protein n=1 Tax=uncultured Pseudacidovorax sp. TaxID=679313 RepID=UPI0025FD4BD3|nr:hypothetical protein [uncultured Pseudacidovorax sp.]
MSNTDARFYAVLAIGGGLGLWWLSRRLSSAGDALGQGITGLGDAIGSAWGAVSDGGRVRQAIGDAGGYAGNVAAGTVEGIGLAVGIPRTNQTQCQQDLAAGRYWAASFSCPAGDYLGGLGSAVWPSTTASQATQADVRRIDNALGRPDGADVFYTPYGIYGGT